MNLLILVQFVLFLLAAILAAVVTPICIKIAEKHNILDYPTWRKLHKKPIPYLGGTTVFVTFWIIVWVAFIFAYLYTRGVGGLCFGFIEPYRYLIEGGLRNVPNMLAIFVGSLVIFLVGLRDDMVHMSPLPKFVAQCAAALVILSCGYSISIPGMPAFIGYVVSFIWILVLINAFNFIAILKPVTYSK